MSDTAQETDRRPCACFLVVGTKGRMCDGACGDPRAMADEIEQLRRWQTDALAIYPRLAGKIVEERHAARVRGTKVGDP